jgi:hypothetical protein
MPQQNDDSVHHLHLVGWSSAGSGSDVGEGTRRALPVATAILAWGPLEPWEGRQRFDRGSWYVSTPSSSFISGPRTQPDLNRVAVAEAKLRP